MFENIEKVVLQAQDVLFFGSWNLLTQKLIFIISLFTLSNTTFFLKACDDSSRFSFFAQSQYSCQLTSTVPSQVALSLNHSILSKLSIKSNF